MFILARAITYSVLFIGVWLIYVPSRLLSRAGIDQPTAFGLPQLSGIIIGALGTIIALSCIFTFVHVGKGTPAPFDPPRRLVERGPYRFVRNPMYIGAGLALAGAALFYYSWPILAYTALFFLATHLFVMGYEEPVLRKTFGGTYEDYCRRVNRWVPSLGK